MSNEILIAEISGKRPGGVESRPTEKYKFKYDKVIISNNSEGYETDWNIVNVPQDYQDWYKKEVATSDIAYYAPMNRSYAIKYAREHGYKYLVQLDDNIVSINIAYRTGKNNFMKYTTSNKTDKQELPNDMVDYLVKVLEFTNAGMAGMQVEGASVPGEDFIRERYVYSFFALKLDIVPDYFQGDFEDDIEFRLKLKQKNIPVVSICPFRYGKIAQNTNGDTTGNRSAYNEVGVNRGKNMSILYGDYYRAGISQRGSGIFRDKEKKQFRHELKAYKVGVKVKDWNFLKSEFDKLLKKYATYRPDTLKTRIIKPTTHISIKIVNKSKKYDVLEELIKLSIIDGVTIEYPKRGSVYDYGLKIENEEDYTEELLKITGIEFE